MKIFLMDRIEEKNKKNEKKTIIKRMTIKFITKNKWNKIHRDEIMKKKAFFFNQHK
jgi:hypothetical protein